MQRIKDSIFVSEWLQSLDTIDKFPEPDHAYAVCDAEPLDDLSRRLVTERQKPNNPDLENLEKVWAGYEGRATAGNSLAIDAFETQRLESLLARFAEKVPYVFLALAPYYDPNYVQFPLKYRTEFEREVSQLSRGNAAIHILPTFPVDCTQMMDTVHLNRKGGEQFAAFLHEQIESALAAEPLTN